MFDPVVSDTVYLGFSWEPAPCWSMMCHMFEPKDRSFLLLEDIDILTNICVSVFRSWAGREKVIAI